MKKKIIIFFTIIIIFSGCIPSNKKVSNPTAKEGILDLSNWILQKDGNVELSGKWEFYWNNYLTSQTIKDKQLSPEFIEVPSIWHEKIIKENFKKYGYGTYRLKIILSRKENIKNNVYTIRIPKVSSAYKLYINKINVHNNGVIGTNRKTTIPDDSPKEIFFSTNTNEIEIIMQVANFHDRHTGIVIPIIFGESKNMKKVGKISNIFNSFIFGTIMFAVIYNLLLFIMRTKDKSSLLFSLICFIVALRTILIKHFLFIEYIPVLSFEVLKTLEFLTLPVGLSFFSLYFYILFKSKTSKFVFYICSFFSLIYSIIIIFFPLRIYVALLTYFQILLIIFCIYMLIKTVYFIIKKREYALLYLIGIFTFSFFIFLEILQHQIETVIINFSAIALLSIIIFHSIIQSMKFSKAFVGLEKHSIFLEEKVKERTTQLENANKELKNMSDEKVNFFMNLVHETKTPLTIIENYLNKDIKTRGDSEDINTVKNNVLKLKDNMINFLDLEKLDKGLFFYNNTLISNVSKLLKNKIIIFMELAKKKKITLASDIADEIYSYIDPFAFDRIINNLMDNALKYTSKNGKIHIKLINENKIIKLIVKDNGIGISKDQLENIFKPYHQISHEKRNIQGLGLGLNIVKKIIDQLGGSIDINSTINEGTEFIVKLDYYKPGKNDQVEDINKDYSHININLKDIELKKEKYKADLYSIFIVEDNLEMLSYLQSALYESYNVFYALNGEEGLEKIKWIPEPKIIISDIMMDKMDGYEFCKTLKENQNYKHIPFIFLTAKSTQDSKIEGLSIGAIDYIQKPFSIEELKLKIQSIINQQEEQTTANIKEFENKISKVLSAPSKQNNIEIKIEKYKIIANEKDVLDLLLKGYEHKEISQQLDISLSTVKRRIYSLYKKCNVQNKVELVNFFKEN